MPVSRSTQPRKQRRAAARAPDHRARKMVTSHLDGDLLVKYNRRSLPVVLGDTVKVLRGSFKGHTDKVIEIDVKKRRIRVEGVTLLQADGTKVPRPLDASNVVITKLNLADPRRREKLLVGVSETEKAKAREELEKEGEQSAKEMEELRRREEEERERRRAEREAEEAALEGAAPPAPAARETAEIEAEPEEPPAAEEKAEQKAEEEPEGSEEKPKKEDKGGEA
jgi:large subunit ribosomal protein L24